MSLAISGISHAAPAYDVEPISKPAAKPTITQQLHNLATSGASSAQIASTLGLPLTEVEEDLGTASTAVTVSAKALSIRI